MSVDGVGPAIAPTPDGANDGAILLVDDNPAKRIALRAVLESLGYRIVEAESGVAALRCVMNEDFAVILLDVCMPVTSGFETAALIRRRRQSEMTPIIFITAYRSDEIENLDRYAEGAVDFMFAPVPPEELRAKVTVFVNLFRNAAALAAKAKDTETSVEQLRLLADAAPIGIFQTDAQNRYVYTNPRWSEITGIAFEAAAGRDWDCIIDESQRDGLRARSRRSGDRLDLHDRFVIAVPEREPRFVLATSTPVPDRHGGVAGWVGTLADVTAEAAAEAAMADARDKANEASRLKSDFLANMSHEIRTPMNGIIGMTDLLLETGLDERQRDYAQTVRNSGEALLAIVNDILDFSKVEAGKLDLEDILFDLRAVVEGTVDLLAGSAQAKGLELLAIVEPSVPDAIGGDPGRLRQVLTNLIGNAIKFTEAGEVVIRTSLLTVGEGRAMIRFDVTDTGVGIAPDKQALIFEPFVQADTSTSRRHGGTGLGLSISGQLVTLMGGDCGVSSRLGEGSAFWFTIDARVDGTEADGVSAPLFPALDAIAVLVVDDSAAVRAVVCEYLTDMGSVPSAVASGPEAMAALLAASTAGHPFPVALIDRSMPGMDGLAVGAAIVNDTNLMPRMVLMTTLSDADASIASGFASTLAKPVHRDHLARAIRTALAVESPPAVAPETPRKRARERLIGRLLLAEDNPINQKVATAMLSSVGYDVDIVPDGAAAVRAEAENHYDAILMDCQMPELNGYEATAAIRANEGTDRHTPIIALTASAQREDRDRCLAAGMDSHLSKPVGKDALLAMVARFVKQASPPTIPPPHTSASPAFEATLDSATIEELCLAGETAERDFLADLVRQFIHDTEPLLVLLGEAFEAGDALTVGRVAQNIRSNGGQLGGRSLVLSCSRLETKAVSGWLSEARPDLHAVEIDYHELRRTLTDEIAFPVVRSETDVALRRSSDAMRPVLDPVVVEHLRSLAESAGAGFLAEVVGLFLSDSSLRMADLRAELAAGNAHGAFEAAHTLTGASGSVGAALLSDLCAALAQQCRAGHLTEGLRRMEVIERELERVRVALASL